MFTDLSFVAWFTFGGIAWNSFEMSVSTMYDIHVRNIHATPILFHTIWGFSEYLRVLFNLVTWTIVLISWASTFLPIQFFHTSFTFVTYWMFFGHGLKYFFLILVKVMSFFIDDYTRDYSYLEDGETIEYKQQKLFYDSNISSNSSAAVMYQEIATITLLMTSFPMLHWNKSDEIHGERAVSRTGEKVTVKDKFFKN